MQPIATHPCCFGGHFTCSCCSRRTPKMRCVFTNTTFTGGHATARSHENRSRGVVLSCRVRWHMRGGMRVPYHARAPQQREQRSRFGHCLHVMCDASLQKQAHLHMLSMYLDQPELSVVDRPPQVRWSKKNDSIYAAREACTQSPGSLIWVFLYQPLSDSNRDKASHRRWVLASLTRTPNLREWICTYQSASAHATNITMFRPNMAGNPFPTLTPMAEQYSLKFTAPLTAVWFPATQPSSELCRPPACMDPVAHVIETMGQAKEARLCAPPRLWKYLIGYHQIGDTAGPGADARTGASVVADYPGSRAGAGTYPASTTDVRSARRRRVATDAPRGRHGAGQHRVAEPVP